jgi:hypothetical protein
VGKVGEDSIKSLNISRLEEIGVGINRSSQGNSAQYENKLYQNRLRMFQKRVLRKILELKMEEVTVGWIKSHEGELHDLYVTQSTRILG